MTIRILLILLTLAPAIGYAEVYRWVDAEGHTHFGDRPPGEVAHQEITINAAPVRGDTSVDERRRKIEHFVEQKQQQRNAEQAANVRAEKLAAKNEAKCRELRARLKYMDRVSTFYHLNDQGERVFVSESENEQIRQRFRKTVQETCGS